MPSGPFFLIGIVFLSVLSFLMSLTSTHAAPPGFVYRICENTTFTPSSNYLLSLTSLLSSLLLYAARDVQFYSTCSGISCPSSNVYNSSKMQISVPIHVIFLCFDYVTAENCRKCVAAGAEMLVSECSKERAAIIWLEDCMVRYSNESIFSTLALVPGVFLYNVNNVSSSLSEPEGFQRLVGTTMTNLATHVSDVPTGAKKFGTKEVMFSGSGELYTYAQCTPDLSSTNCNICLQEAIDSLAACCGGKRGGRVMFPSCTVRYELYRFYPTGSATGQLPLPPPGKSEVLTTQITVVVAPIAVCLVLFLLA